MKKLTILSFCIVLVFCVSLSSSAFATSDEEEVLQVEMNFIKALNTGDYELISSLYWHSSKTSTFNPGNRRPFLCQGWDETLDSNWKTISSFAETGTGSAHNLQAVFIKDDVAVLTGYETLVETDATTQEQTITNNRFTRVVQKIGGKWLIVHDHASVLPVE